MSRTSTCRRVLVLVVLLLAALAVAGQSAATTTSSTDEADARRPHATASAKPSPTSRPTSRPEPGRPFSDLVITGGPAQQRRAAAKARAQATTVDHHLTIVPIYWGDTVPASPTTADLQTDVARLSSYYADVTRGEVVIADRATVTDWVQIDAPDSCNGLFSTLFAAAAAKAGGLADGEHLVAYMPRYWDCWWAGVATVGGHQMALNGDTTLRVLAHEFGHNLGLHHSNALNCYTGADHATQVPLSSHCEELEYWDLYDVMGHQAIAPPGVVGQLSGDGLNKIGVTIGHRTLLTSADVTLEPIAGTGAGTRLLRIPADGRMYTVEYRTAVGRDAWIDDRIETDPTHGQVVMPGEGLVIRADDGMLDLHPELGGSWPSPPMRVGDALTTLDGQVTITYLGNSPAGARVRVTRTPTADRPPVIWEVRIFDSYTDVPGLDLGISGVSDDDTGLAKIEVFVDGTLAARRIPANPYSQWTGIVEVRRLTVGPHTVKVVATDRAGNATTWGPEKVSIAANGRTAPTVADVRVTGLRSGTTSLQAVPASVAWSSSAQCGLARHRVTLGHRRWEAGRAAQQARVTARSGPNTFAVQAFDWCGWRTTATSPEVTVRVNPVTRTGRHGRWATAAGRNLLGGSIQVSSQRGARITATVRGRSVGWVATTCPRCGKAAVLVDGRRVATIDLRTRRARVRQQVWVTNFARRGRHRIAVVNLGTRRRSTVTVDGFTALR